MSTVSAMFIAFLMGMAAVVVAAAFRIVGKRWGAGMFIGLMAWFAYVALLADLGVLQRADTRPPGVLFILVPVVMYLAGVVLSIFASQAGVSLVTKVPLGFVIGLQAFRVIIELFIHQLWKAGVVPEMLTFRGANVDIYIGASAPLVAILIRLSSRRTWIALLWNGLGLLALANVVIRAILTSPGPLHFIHVDPPNHMFSVFPFMFIPAFFVPLAVTLHLLAIRKILWAARSGQR